VYISPATAKRLGIENEDLVELENRGRKLRVAAWIVPGQADDCLTMYLGNGRRVGGRVATNAGFNAYLLRVSDQPWGGPGIQLRKTGDRHKLATTQEHHSMEGRGIVRSATLVEYQKDPEFPKHEEAEPPKSQSLYPEYSYTRYKWGMAIDQNACIGCSACVVACQAENNIPVVGKDQVLRGREMHWLRIDRYHKGDAANPEMFNQPMLCQQCENAPCELVCPVAATVHSGDGLNQMVYNRCVGTRYCSNNCPYKVRRFNFYLYSDWYTQSLYGMRNPNVTVRSRGVMEKCTYCVQRINNVKIEAEKEDRPLRDGEIVTACQAACPTRAIVFGDMNDPESAVTRLKAQPLNYSVLGDLNTQPRTTYLARVKNTNPELERT
jgi:molybdopterin-containing oxidoreductase family iron-sulfur binding subunit